METKLRLLLDSVFGQDTKTIDNLPTYKKNVELQIAQQKDEIQSFLKTHNSEFDDYVQFSVQLYQEYEKIRSEYSEIIKVCTRLTRLTKLL